MNRPPAVVGRLGSLNLVAARADSRVLELGCGSGNYVRAISEKDGLFQPGGPLCLAIDSKKIIRSRGRQFSSPQPQQKTLKARSKSNSIKAKKNDDYDGASANRRCPPNCWARSRSQNDAVCRSSLGLCERTFQTRRHRLHEAPKPPNDRPTCVCRLSQSRNERHLARSRNYCFRGYRHHALRLILLRNAQLPIRRQPPWETLQLKQ